MVNTLHCLGMSYYVNFLGGLGSNEFHKNEGLAPMAGEKIKILGAVLELPVEQFYWTFKSGSTNQEIVWKRIWLVSKIFKKNQESYRSLNLVSKLGCR